MTTDLSIEYDEEFERYVVDFDWGDLHSTSEVVVYAVAEISGEDVTSLRPLAEVIDPDALDAIFDRASDDPGNAHIAFEYHGYEITVFSHGRLTLTETS